MKAGRKIFYDKITGERIVDTGEWDNVIREKTVDEEIASFPSLSERNRESYDVLKLPFGAYRQDFAESGGYRVNPITKLLEFTPKPITPEEPPVYQKPFSEQIARQEEQILELNLQDISMMEMLIERGLI